MNQLLNVSRNNNIERCNVLYSWDPYMYMVSTPEKVRYAGALQTGKYKLE
jgi:hypothetical protein